MLPPKIYTTWQRINHQFNAKWKNCFSNKLLGNKCNRHFSCVSNQIRFHQMFVWCTLAYIIVTSEKKKTKKKTKKNKQKNTHTHKKHTYMHTHKKNNNNNNNKQKNKKKQKKTKKNATFWVADNVNHTCIF